VQSVTITTKVVSLNPIHGEVYSIQHYHDYVIKFVSDFQQVCGFSLGNPVSSTNKTDHHDIPEILLKVALSIINQPKPTIFKIKIIFFIWIFLFLSLLQQYYGYMYFKPTKLQYLNIIRQLLFQRGFAEKRILSGGSGMFLSLVFLEKSNIQMCFLLIDQRRMYSSPNVL
jgi:hypothetical protein